MVRPPRLQKGHPGRQQDCEDALEGDVFALLDRYDMPSKSEIEEMLSRARTHGWRAEEIAAALIDLGGRYLKPAGQGK